MGADSENDHASKRRSGRPPWTPNLNQVRMLAAQGMTMERIAEALGVGLSTLYRKKVQFREFGEAIRKGAAEGEVVVTNKLFEAAKQGKAWAICFYLKTRCGWHENFAGGANVNVSVNGWSGASLDEERARERDEQERLIKLLTHEERSQYLKFMDRIARRQRGEQMPVEVMPLSLLGDDLEPLEEEDAASLQPDSMSAPNPGLPNAKVNSSVLLDPTPKEACPKCGRRLVPGEGVTLNNGVLVWHSNCRPGGNR
jgi:hypothetical protein